MGRFANFQMAFEVERTFGNNFYVLFFLSKKIVKQGIEPSLTIASCPADPNKQSFLSRYFFVTLVCAFEPVFNFKAGTLSGLLVANCLDNRTCDRVF